MNRFAASPTSRAELERKADIIRRALEADGKPFLDIVRVVERLFGEKLQIVEPEEMGELHGLTDTAAGVIYLRRDVYDGACEGKGRDRFTIAHEFSHYLLHNGMVLGFARIEKDVAIPRYMDPEWQANALAGALLMPRKWIKGRPVEEVMTLCGVSRPAAVLQLRIVGK